MAPVKSIFVAAAAASALVLTTRATAEDVEAEYTVTTTGSVEETAIVIPITNGSAPAHAAAAGDANTVDAISIPIHRRPRGQATSGDAKAESIKSESGPVEDETTEPEYEAKHVFIPGHGNRHAAAAGDANTVDAINIPIHRRPRGQATSGDATAESIKSESVPVEDVTTEPAQFRGEDVESEEGSYVSAQMTCAPSGQAYCAASKDMNVINTAAYATALTDAAAEVFISQMPGAQALEGTIGNGRLTSSCLTCQGAYLDCSVQQTQCYSVCAESSCGAECRGCIQQKCDLRKVCGGEPGVSIQSPYSCMNNDPNLMVVNLDLLNLPFTGDCSRRLDAGHTTDDLDRTEILV